jgi:hypothetical protein
MIMDSLSEAEKEYMESEIKKHAERLSLDMNLRLLCDISLNLQDSVLWVDSISVTGITYPKQKQMQHTGIKRCRSKIMGFFKKLFRHDKR